MTVAATSEFSAASGTNGEPQHWLDQVTLEGDARHEFLKTILDETQRDVFLEWLYSKIEKGKELEAFENTARRIDNRTIIALMREKLFGEQNNLPEFLKSGISPNLRDQKTGQTLLMAECSCPRAVGLAEEDKAERVANMIYRQWDIVRNWPTVPNLKDNGGETALTLAAQNGRVEVLDVLAFYTDSPPRNARKESPLCLLLSADYSAAPPSTVKSCLDRLIGSHDFAGMPEKGPESFEEMSSAFKKLCKRGIQDNNEGRSFMYLDALAHFSHANDQYHREETAQLRAQLAAAQKELGKEEVPALLQHRPS